MASIFIRSHPCCIRIMDLLHLLVIWMSKHQKFNLFMLIVHALFTYEMFMHSSPMTYI